MSRKGFEIVVAATFQNGIGFKGKMPWPRIKEDMTFFQRLTCKSAAPGKRHAVIMGRKTWDSLPDTACPLKGRANIVLTRHITPKDETKMVIDTEVPDSNDTSVHVAHDFQQSLDVARQLPNVDRIFVIGGGEIYKLALAHLDCIKIHMTNIYTSYECDTFFPSPSHYDFVLGPEEEQSARFVDAESKVPIQWVSYVRDVINTEEMQYLKLIDKILAEGAQKDDRTGTGTKSIFGHQMKFDLRNNRFPLLTTKRVFFKGVAEELLWMLNGCTNAKELAAKGVNIWNDNSDKKTLTKMGYLVVDSLEVEIPDCEFKKGPRLEYDCGPIYGFQWRHFGAQYTDCKADYTGKGFDQIAWLVNEIKTNPNSRRLVLNAWNPCDMDQMVLPPCHMSAVFDVTDGHLNCAMTQRSVDVGLGLPFNLASYSLLTIMLAHVTGLKPGTFTHFGCNTHIYLNHIDALRSQATRLPREFPTLRINSSAASKKIDEFDLKDFELIGYEPYESLVMKMAV